jgi:UMF1 family MFS transporter
MLLGGVDEFDQDEGGGKGTKSEGEMTGYADKRGRWGWMLFDWASQPYHTLIITFIFACGAGPPPWAASSSRCWPRCWGQWPT